MKIIPKMKLLEDELNELEDTKLKLEAETAQLEADKEQAENEYNSLSKNYQQVITFNNEQLNDLYNDLARKRISLEQMNNNHLLKENIINHEQALILNTMQTEIANITKQNTILHKSITTLYKQQEELTDNSINAPLNKQIQEQDIDIQSEESFSFEKEMSNIEDWVKWYEDLCLVASYVYSIDVVEKLGLVKVRLENKQAKGNVIIKCFEASDIDSTCIFLFAEVM